jgi:hypothetical protein
MDRKTAVLVITNAMQSDKDPEDIAREVDELLQTVDPDQREAVIAEAKDICKKAALGLPIDPIVP